MIDPRTTASRSSIPRHHHHFPCPSPTLTSPKKPMLTKVPNLTSKSIQKSTLASMQKPTSALYHHMHSHSFCHDYSYLLVILLFLPSLLNLYVRESMLRFYVKAYIESHVRESTLRSC